MRFLVTGSNGFIGRHLTAALGTADYDTFNRGDRIPVGSYDVIFHLAAELYDPDNMFDSNVFLTRNLLTLEFGKFISLGSSSEYGKTTRPSKETDRIQPVSTYETTKAAATVLCMDAAASGEDVCVVRPFSVYGPGAPHFKFIPTLVRCLHENLPMLVYPGVHDWVHVSDLVEFLLQLSVTPPEMTRGDIINFGMGDQTSNLEVAKTLFEVAGKEIPVRKAEHYKYGYDRECWEADMSHCWSKYHTEPSIQLRDGLKALYEASHQ
jgi:nucleoside-diphosphate-sugar epimerase